MRSRILLHLFGSLRHHWGLMTVTILVLTGSFFVSGSLLLFGQNLSKVLTLWGESLQMSVYLKDDATPEQTDRLKELLTGDKRIGRSEFVNREKALVSFQEQMASYAPDLLNDTQLMRFIPESFQLQLSDSIGSARQFDTLKILAQELKSYEGVEDVSYGQDWVKTYASLVQTFQRVGGWIVLLLIAASAFVIANAVSSSINQRRNEIEVLELVGASSKFIRTPFLVEGLVVGLFAGMMSMALLALAFSFVRSQFREQIAFLQLSHHLEFFSIGVSGLFLLAAAFIGLGSAYLCLRKLNDGWSASRLKQGF